jgi:hypothetical protein
MKILISLSVIAISASIYCAGIIKGNVINYENIPMAEANITLSGTNMGSASNDEGNYVIKNVPAGTYTVKCSFIGHSDVSLKGVIVENDSVRVVDFLLFPLEYQMEEIAVEQDEEDINGLLYFRDLAFMEMVREYNIPSPELKGKIDVRTKPGFWEMFRYYIYRIFN